MRRLFGNKWFWLAPCVMVVSAYAHSGQGVVSSMRNVNAVMQARGFYASRAADVAVEQGPGDLAPPQAFEIIRPRGEKVTIGRLYTSCSCVQLEAPKRTFERGERAVLYLRNVVPSPPQGQNYAMYIQLTSPIRTTLRVDTFLQSSQFVTAPAESTEPESDTTAVTGADLTADNTIEVIDLTRPDRDAAGAKAEETVADTADDTATAKSESEAVDKDDDEDAATAKSDSATEEKTETKVTADDNAADKEEVEKVVLTEKKEPPSEYDAPKADEAPASADTPVADEKE